MDTIKIGEFLKSLRKVKGYTQQQVADELYLSAKAISRWETGEGLPDINIISAVAEFYGVTVDEILSGERKNTQREQTQQTIALKSNNNARVLTESLVKKFNGYFIASLITFGVLTIISIILFFLGYLVIAFTLEIIGILTSVFIIYLGNHEVNHFHTEEDSAVMTKALEQSKKETKIKKIILSDLIVVTCAVYSIILILARQNIYYIFLTITLLLCYFPLRNYFSKYSFTENKELLNQKLYTCLIPLCLGIIIFFSTVEVMTNNSYSKNYSFVEFIDSGILDTIYSFFGLILMFLSLIPFFILKKKKHLYWLPFISLALAVTANLIVGFNKTRFGETRSVSINFLGIVYFLGYVGIMIYLIILNKKTDKAILKTDTSVSE